MDRGASSAVLAEMSAKQCQPIHLVSVETSGGTTYLTDAYTDITYSGNVYQAVGYFLGFSDIQETSNLQVSRISVSLTASDNAQYFIAELLNNDYLDRQLIIYKGFLDSSDALIADPILYFDGRMDQPIISEDPASGEATISVDAANQFIDWERSQYRTTNHESQDFHFPGDLGMEFASEIIEEIFWGRKTP